MNRYTLFSSIDEPFAAGFFEEEGRSLFFRHSLALRRFYENRPLNRYDSNRRLYPSGVENISKYAIKPQYARTFSVDYDTLQSKSPEAAKTMEGIDGDRRGAGYRDCGFYVMHNYTHSIPHYERILAEGLDAYQARVERMRDADLREGLLHLLAGFRNYHSRCVQYLKRESADQTLIAALERVPFQPAQNIYQAILGWNFILYLDGADNYGWLDNGLCPYHNGEDVTNELRELFENGNDNAAWSAAIGPFYNDLTGQCLVAIQGRRRPMLALRLTEHMPDDIWELAFAALRTGCSNPSFYNEDMIARMLKQCFPGVRGEDRIRFCGAGCTETNLAGLSNIGSIDADINLALIFERYMHENLALCESFTEFYQGLCKTVADCVDAMLAAVFKSNERMAQNSPHPIRTLFTDDCIDKELDFNNGGARINAEMTAECGLINAIDSLLAIRKLVFETKQYTAPDFLRLLTSEDPLFYLQLKNCPRYGVDDRAADELAHRFSDMFYSCFAGKKAFRGGPVIPTSHQFNRYIAAGAKVGPTPDGRRKGDPLCDSIAPLGGKSTNGPTAAMVSASKIAQEKIFGIPVLNITLGKRFIGEPLRRLVQGYMSLSGVMVQVTVASRAEMLDALEHPERHEDLIVRVGGYSEAFNRLTPELKQALINRTLYE